MELLTELSEVTAQARLSKFPRKWRVLKTCTSGDIGVNWDKGGAMHIRIKTRTTSKLIVMDIVHPQQYHNNRKIEENTVYDRFAHKYPIY